MNVLRTTRIIILVFAVLLLAVPACNMNNTDNATSEIEAKMAETGSIIPRTVEIDREQVSIAIEIPSGETEFGLYSPWVYLFNIALESAT